MLSYQLSHRLKGPVQHFRSLHEIALSSVHVKTSTSVLQKKITDKLAMLQAYNAPLYFLRWNCVCRCMRAWWWWWCLSSKKLVLFTFFFYFWCVYYSLRGYAFVFFLCFFSSNLDFAADPFRVTGCRIHCLEQDKAFVDMFAYFSKSKPLLYEKTNRYAHPLIEYQLKSGSGSNPDIDLDLVP